MGTTCVPRRILCSTLKKCKWRYLVYNRRRLESVAMATEQWCHLVPFMMNIYGAKFEERRFNILRDMLDSVIYLFCKTINDVITFLYLHNTKT